MRKPEDIQRDINNVLWKACDTFRGIIDPSQYKDYILTMLFIKYLSDVWKDKRQAYLEKYNGDEVRADRAMKHERFVLSKHCTFDHLYENRNEPNLGELINIALEDIEEENRQKLEGVFRKIDFNNESNLGQTKERNARLKHLLEDFADARLDLRPSVIGKEDIIGNAYEYLISRFASDAGKKGGEFYTPGDVATLLAKLLQPKPGARICDPTCGSGSLLIKVAHEIGNNNFSLYGQELNGSTWALCKMNMFLHDYDSADIRWGDTIRNPLLLENDELMKFDIVVANPPFSLDKWGADVAENDKYKRFWRGVPPKSKGDFAFISHMVEVAHETNGKVGVVVPHGVLFRGGAEKRIRQQMIDNNHLEAVIGLPANLFYGTGIPAALLIFNKAKKTKDILFIDASEDYVSNKNQNSLGEAVINKIVSAYNEFKTQDKFSYLATYKEVTDENDYNLNIPRYVDKFEEEEDIDIAAVQTEITKIEEELKKTQKTISEYLKELGV